MKAPINVPGYNQLRGKRGTYDIKSVDETSPSNRSVECTFGIGYGGDGRRVKSEWVSDPI